MGGIRETHGGEVGKGQRGLGTGIVGGHELSIAEGDLQLIHSHGGLSAVTVSEDQIGIVVLLSSGRQGRRRTEHHQEKTFHYI